MYKNDCYTNAICIIFGESVHKRKEPFLYPCRKKNTQTGLMVKKGESNVGYV